MGDALAGIRTRVGSATGFHAGPLHYQGSIIRLAVCSQDTDFSGLRIAVWHGGRTPMHANLQAIYKGCGKFSLKAEKTMD